MVEPVNFNFQEMQTGLLTMGPVGKVPWSQKNAMPKQVSNLGPFAHKVNALKLSLKLATGQNSFFHL